MTNKDIENYIGYMRYRNFSKNTINFYSRVLIEYIKSRQDIKSYLLTMSAKETISAITRNKKYYALRSFFNWYSQEEKQPNPMREIKAPHFQEKHPQILTQYEVKKMLSYIKWDIESEARTGALITLLASTGCRIQEALDITIDETGNQIYSENERNYFWIKNTKSRKDRTLPISGRNLGKIVLFLYRKAVPSLWLFSLADGRRMTRKTANYWVKKIAKRAGINKRVSPHTFRHSLATHLVDQGVPFKTIQEYFGWASIDMLNVYVHLSKNAFKEISGKNNLLPDTKGNGKG